MFYLLKQKNECQTMWAGVGVGLSFAYGYGPCPGLLKHLGFQDKIYWGLGNLGDLS